MKTPPFVQTFSILFEKLFVRIFYNPSTIENYFRRKGVRIGKGNRILTRSFSSEPYLIQIGNNNTISSDVSFITHDGGCGIFRKEVPGLNVYGTIVIKDNCFIGRKSILMPNITIGPNAIVGAAAVVTKDVPPNTIVVGNPARIVSTVQEYRDKCIQKFNSLNLQGPKENWREQLENHFWKS